VAGGKGKRGGAGWGKGVASSGRGKADGGKGVVGSGRGVACCCVLVV